MPDHLQLNSHDDYISIMIILADKKKKRIQYNNNEEIGEFLSTIPYETELLVNEEDAYKNTKEC